MVFERPARIAYEAVLSGMSEAERGEVRAHIRGVLSSEGVLSAATR